MSKAHPKFGPKFKATFERVDAFKGDAPRRRRRGNVPAGRPLYFAHKYQGTWWFVYETVTEKGYRNFKVIADECRGKSNFWISLSRDARGLTRSVDGFVAKETWPEELYNAILSSMRVIAQTNPQGILVNDMDAKERYELPKEVVPDTAVFGPQVRDAIIHGSLTY